MWPTRWRNSTLLLSAAWRSNARPVRGRSTRFSSGYVILQTALGDVRRVYDDVFRMARAYHWSEAEILSLPLRRRRHYLAIAEVAEASP